MSSCRECSHYEICYIAKQIRDLYHNVPFHFIHTDNYEKLIDWAQGFAQFCLKFKEKEKNVQNKN